MDTNIQMNNTPPPQQDVIGTVLKWISPVVIGIFGYISVQYLKNIEKITTETKTSIEAIKNKQSDAEKEAIKFNFQLENLQQRVEKLEYKRATIWPYKPARTIDYNSITV